MVGKLKRTLWPVSNNFSRFFIVVIKDWVTDCAVRSGYLTTRFTIQICKVHLTSKFTESILKVLFDFLEGLHNVVKSFMKLHIIIVFYFLYSLLYHSFSEISKFHEIFLVLVRTEYFEKFSYNRKNLKVQKANSKWLRSHCNKAKLLGCQQTLFKCAWYVLTSFSQLV